jgi:hypothetical protein
VIAMHVKANASSTDSKPASFKPSIVPRDNRDDVMTGFSNGLCIEVRLPSKADWRMEKLRQMQDFLLTRHEQK